MIRNLWKVIEILNFIKVGMTLFSGNLIRIGRAIDNETPYSLSQRKFLCLTLPPFETRLIDILDEF